MYDNTVVKLLKKTEQNGIDPAKNSNKKYWCDVRYEVAASLQDIFETFGNRVNPKGIDFGAPRTDGQDRLVGVYIDADKPFPGN